MRSQRAAPAMELQQGCPPAPPQVDSERNEVRRVGALRRHAGCGHGHGTAERSLCGAGLHGAGRRRLLHARRPSLGGLVVVVVVRGVCRGRRIPEVAHCPKSGANGRAMGLRKLSVSALDFAEAADVWSPRIGCQKRRARTATAHVGSPTAESPRRRNPSPIFARTQCQAVGSKRV